MAERVNFQLVTPECVVVEQEADLVVVPGGDGNFGVLPGHAPLLSTLRPGVIDIYEGTAVTARIFVGGGFAEVGAEGFTVLADEAMPFEDINADAAAQRLRDAHEALINAKVEDEGVAAAEAQLKVAEALVALAGGSRA